ncbi:MAG TPA: VOC family protein [Burkholderiales bacterium]|nr:VOC family protein [Burkholderiales bacterium]
MSVQLNHTIVMVRDKLEAARFYTEILGLSEATRFGPFMVVTLANGVSLDFDETQDKIVPLHYAFLVNDDEFDRSFDRIRARGLDYWADPRRSQAGEINFHFGGRGVYFQDPSGHLLELITRPYDIDQ